MAKLIGFGETVEGYSVPVLNEREVRAAAGILFVLMFLGVILAAAMFKFTLIKYAIVIFLTDFVIRVLVNPKYSPTLILARLIVGNQTPEYVWSAPKKFAWYIGLSLSVIMFVFMVVMNTYSPITGLICLICLIFLFFESAFGICLGCMFYPLFFKEKIQLCPGDICEVKPKQEIQKTSMAQILIVCGFVAYIVLATLLFKETFIKQPYDLFGIFGTEQGRR